MKTVLHEIEAMTIEQFADKHGLEMVISERRLPVGDPSRYYAKFENAEAKHGECCLIGLYGNGSTPDEAVDAYTEEISLRTLVIDSMRSTRREIVVPRLVVAATLAAHGGKK